MKLSHLTTQRRGFTVIEVTIATALMTIVGGMIYIVLNSGMNLYAKNTAVNAAHQQARSGVDQMLHNIHGAVSVPQLVDTNLAAIAAPGVGPAAGITFQRFEGGPFPVVLNALASATSIDVNLGSPLPGATPYVATTNSRLNIPPHNIELNVVSTTNLGGDQRRYTFSQPIGTDVTIWSTGDDADNPLDDVTYVISAFMTYRCSYAVIGTELRYYPSNDLATYRVIARNITSATPFTIPPMPPPPGGTPPPVTAPRNRYVAAVNISTVEPQFTERGYAAVNMFISSLIPFRCRLTDTQ